MKRWLIIYLALLTTASSDPVADTRQIMAGTVATKSVKQAYLSGARDTTSAFQGALAAYKAVRAAEVPTPPPTPKPPAVTWTKCADETLTCTVVGTANVRYGAGTTWTAPRVVTGSIACDNMTWGDPVVGTGKQCQTDGAVAPPAPTPTPVPAPTSACPNGIPRLLNGDCPPGNGLTMTQCPDKVYVLMGQNCPALPKVGQWVDAPIQQNGWAQVVKGQPGWPQYGSYGHCDIVNGLAANCTFSDIPGTYPAYDYTNTYRASVPGEYCHTYQNGGGYDAESHPTWSVRCLYDGQTLVLRQDNLRGVAPASGYTPVFGSGPTIMPYTQALNPTP